MQMHSSNYYECDTFAEHTVTILGKYERTTSLAGLMQMYLKLASRKAGIMAFSRFPGAERFSFGRTPASPRRLRHQRRRRRRRLPLLLRPRLRQSQFQDPGLELLPRNKSRRKRRRDKHRWKIKKPRAEVLPHRTNNPHHRHRPQRKIQLVSRCRRQEEIPARRPIVKMNSS